MAIFFTADTHFGHKNIIRYCNRPFETAHEMNETLIANWNKVVHQTDTVYHLGDVAVLRPEKTRDVLDRLNGKFILLLVIMKKLRSMKSVSLGLNGLKIAFT